MPIMNLELFFKFHKESDMGADTAANKAKNVVDTGADAVETAIDDVASKATAATRRAKEVASESIDEGRDAVAQALQCATSMIRERPITSVAVVGLIAYIWGRVS